MGMFKVPEATLAIRRQRKDQQLALTALNYATRYGKNQKVKVERAKHRTISKPSIWAKYGHAEKS